MVRVRPDPRSPLSWPLLWPAHCWIEPPERWLRLPEGNPCECGLAIHRCGKSPPLPASRIRFSSGRIIRSYNRTQGWGTDQQENIHARKKGIEGRPNGPGLSGNGQTRYRTALVPRKTAPKTRFLYKALGLVMAKLAAIVARAVGHGA